MITNGGTAEDQALWDRARKLGNEMWQSIADYQNNSPRSLQSTMRILGMSEIGGCREYLRASVAGDKKDDLKEVKWAAAIGTAVGDWVEEALGKTMGGVTTQVTIQLELPTLGIKVPGHSDVFVVRHGQSSDVVDLKTKDGLAEIKSKGPSFKELCQVSGYLCAAIDNGTVESGSVGYLAYMDRAGNDKGFWMFPISEDQARDYIRQVEDRLLDVADALGSGESQGYLRDEPETWCWYVSCPFYTACWPADAYKADGFITEPQHLDAMEQYDHARDMIKHYESLRRNAINTLNKGIEHRVEGISDRFTLNWKTKPIPGTGEMIDTIDLRKRRPL